MELADIVAALEGSIPPLTDPVLTPEESRAAEALARAYVREQCKQPARLSATP